MKTLLIALAIIALLVGVLFIANPVLMVLSSGGNPKVKSEAKVSDRELVARLTLTDAKSPMFVVSLVVPRDAADRIGIAAPSGFRVESLVDAKSDPAWIENWNKENVRYVGKLQVVPESPVEVRFPLKSWQPPPFQIRGQFEAGRTFMNSMSFFHVKVGE